MRTMQMILFLVAIMTPGCDISGMPKVIWDDTGVDTGEEPVELTSTWVDITGGYCSVSALPYGTSELEELGVVNIAPGDDSVRFVGDPGALLYVECDATFVPNYPPPSAKFDPDGCAKVYCNPHGNTNRSGGESEDCGNNLVVYQYPSSDGYGTTLPDHECGPWNLE